MLCIVLLSVVGLVSLPDRLPAAPRVSAECPRAQYAILRSQPGGGAILDRLRTQSSIPAHRRSDPRPGSHGAFSGNVNVALVVEPPPLVVEPFEDELSAGVTSLFKGVRYCIRRSIRFMGWSANRWAQWMLRALGFFTLAVLAPLINLDLLATWREKGWVGLRDSILLGVAVYMRLLLDRHAPLLGKLAIVFALLYCVVSRDLVPDTSFPLGALDDALAVVLASRGFMLLCPESLVEAHAILAARAGERRRAWQRSVPPPAA